VDAVEREDVLVARSRALGRVARPVEAWEPARQACRSALARSDRDAAATALLSVTEGMVWGWRPHPAYDDDAIALWREVRALFSADVPEESITWAHLTAALAAELLHRPGSSDESVALSDAAVAVVRRSEGRGPRELQVLRLAQVGLLRPALLHHRVPLADEVVALASRVGQPHDLSGALAARAQDRGELGRLDAALSDVVRAREVAERHRLAQNLAVTGWCLSLRRMMDGHLDDAEQMIEDNEAFQATLAVSGHGIGLCQLTLLRDLQGRAGELEPVLRRVRAHHPGLRELHALAMVRVGRLDELRLLLGEWGEQPSLLEDYLWVFLQAVRADVWSALGDAAAARELFTALAPYADRLAISVPVGFHGSVHLALGRLAATTGDRSAADEHLAAARDVHAGLGLDLWVQRTDAELERLRGGLPRSG
jgi:hypothetical protein